MLYGLVESKKKRKKEKRVTLLLLFFFCIYFASFNEPARLLIFSSFCFLVLSSCLLFLLSVSIFFFINLLIFQLFSQIIFRIILSLFSHYFSPLQGLQGLWWLYLFRYVLLFSSIIPISLRVNLDMAKTLYSYWISSDAQMPGAVSEKIPRKSDEEKKSWKNFRIFSPRIFVLYFYCSSLVLFIFSFLDYSWFFSSRKISFLFRLPGVPTFPRNSAEFRFCSRTRQARSHATKWSLRKFIWVRERRIQRNNVRGK